MKKSTSCAVRLVVELTISPLTQQPRSSSALQQNVHSTRRPLALCLFLAAVLVSQNRRDDVLLSSRLSRTTGDSFCPNGIRSGPQAEVTLAASFVTENFFVSSRRQKHNRQCGGKWKRRDASHKPCSAFLCRSESEFDKYETKSDRRGMCQFYNIRGAKETTELLQPTAHLHQTEPPIVGA